MQTYDINSHKFSTPSLFNCDIDTITSCFSCVVYAMLVSLQTRIKYNMKGQHTTLYRFVIISYTHYILTFFKDLNACMIHIYLHDYYNFRNAPLDITVKHVTYHSILKINVTSTKYWIILTYK